MADWQDETSPLQQPAIRRRNTTGWTKWLIYSTTVAVMGSSFQFGYNSSCINAPEGHIRGYFESHGKPLSEFEWSAIVAIFAVGGLIGALFGPLLASIIGRKRTLLFNNILAFAGAVFMILSYYTKRPALLIFGRFIIGLNAGVNTSVAPIYLSEIAPVQLRGSLGTLNQFGICSGILAGYILGLSEVLGSGSRWPWLLGFSIVPAAIQIFMLPCCPRSPRYLLLNLNQEAATVRALQILRGTTDVNEDIAEMRIEQERALREPAVGILELFRVRSLRLPLAIGIVMQMSQQLSGINAVIYYSTSIFEKAQFVGSQYATVAVGVISVLMTVLVVWLVERLGRRTLMLWGMAGMFVFYGVMTLAFRFENLIGMRYLAVVGTLILVIFFQLGPGPIPWFITAEIFSQGPRPAACTIASVVNWFCNFIVGILFPSMQTALYPYTFTIFMVLLLGFWVFTYFLVPETKGRTIEEITSKFRGETSSSVNYDRLHTEDKEVEEE